MQVVRRHQPDVERQLEALLLILRSPMCAPRNLDAVKGALGNVGASHGTTLAAPDSAGDDDVRQEGRS